MAGILTPLFLFCLCLCAASPLGAAEQIHLKNVQNPCFSRLKQFNSSAIEAYRQGDYGAGILAAEKAYHYALNCLGKFEPATLESMNNLAALYDVDGDYEKAEPLYKEALRLYGTTLGAEHPVTLTFMNNLAALYEAQGFYDKARPLYEQSMTAREKVLGKAHPDTLASMTYLASLYYSQGFYDKAEPLYHRVLKLRREFLGARHPDTLASMNYLAGLYYSQGRYDQAESLYKEALETRKKILGDPCPDSATFINKIAGANNFKIRYGDAEPLPGGNWQSQGKALRQEDIYTMSSMHNLAFLYQTQGDYEKAETLYKEALRLRKKNLGETHSDTLASIDSLAGLYYSNAWYEKAEPLYKKALEIRKKNLGGRHPATLAAMNNLAFLYQTQGLYKKAEPIYKEELSFREKLFGKTNPDTLSSMNNLAFLYQVQGRYEEAETLYQNALGSYRKTLGKKHPDTLAAVNNLAAIYYSLGRYDEAEPLYKEALDIREKIYEKDDPDTLLFRLNYILLTLTLNKTPAAFELLKQMEARLVSASSRQLSRPATDRKAKLFLYVISNFQDVALSLAEKFPQPEYTRYAANVIFRWKQAYAREQALDRHRLESKNKPYSKSKAAGHLETDASRPEWFQADLGQAFDFIPENSAIIEFRQSRHIDFKTGAPGELYFAAYLLSRSQTEKRLDFAYIGETDEIINILLDSKGETKALYEKLFGPFDAALTHIKTVFIAPDGFLNLIPFSSLRMPDGTFMARRHEVNRLLAGRDIMETPGPVSHKGDIALFGGAVYGKFGGEFKAGDPKTDQGESPTHGRLVADEFAPGVKYMEQSKRETGRIAGFFQKKFPQQRSWLYVNDQASEKSLKHMGAPPAALHFSTRGFYLQNKMPDQSKETQHVPFSSSGLMLSGANQGMSGVLDAAGDDGILYGSEILKLNLTGVELASITSCVLGKTANDYSEGVDEMARAFKTAGVQSVLMPLRPVDDEIANEFMVKFYEIWLDPMSPMTPAAALGKTRLYFMDHPDQTRRAPNIWSSHIIIDGHLQTGVNPSGR